MATIILIFERQMGPRGFVGLTLWNTGLDLEILKCKHESKGGFKLGISYNKWKPLV